MTAASRVASVDHLIEMKRRADRPRDHDDIIALQEIRDEDDGHG